MAEKAYIFYSRKENGLNSVYLKEVPYATEEEYARSLAAVIESVLRGGKVDYLVIQNNATFPDTKTNFLQGELYNLGQRAANSIAALEQKVNDMTVAKTVVKRKTKTSKAAQ
jgi:hypothetical protein